LESTPLGKRSSKEINYRRFSSGSYSGSLSTNIVNSNQDEEMRDDGSDAQAALKKMMESRTRRQGK
jgi:hypothetical protein